MLKFIHQLKYKKYCNQKDAVLLMENLLSIIF